MTRVKICGISDPADARRVADLGAWALGMIFWPQSPRACALDDAEAIGAELRRRLLGEAGGTAARPADDVLELGGQPEQPRL